MPFLKFSRDKRGYENYSLFDGGKHRPRLLFWFRTPPQIKVGREPFSDDVRRMVEAQNPGIHFDWARIMATPIPAPEVEHWRERRRAEKAAKRAVRDAEAAEAAEAAAESAAVDEPEVAVEETAPREDVEAVTEAAESARPSSDVQGPQPPQGQRRRRRRRGRRGGGGSVQPAAQQENPADTAPASPEMPSDDEV